ncbi:MAG: hypothetical protein A3F68_10180 [Acidobacteria bacterium RIFCSPLOWO2_12_FULL_54_10]|nr:MAG: hypothetical protein A3F68_10180 [Acidobacteria bacterium RIFCSPLOWO2_12_FULL_54_10]
MAILITGSTGYIGGHVAASLLENHSVSLNLLVRAKDASEAEHRLWHSFQLHFSFPRLMEHLRSRIHIFRGDLTESRFGLSPEDYHRLVQSTDSVIHCAASLNRKSEKTCLNVNLRGTLEVIQLASRARDNHGLRRFSHVSTVAVAGHRSHEIVQEDQAIDWNRSDYDPYARTKKFCEHMIRELLADVPLTFFRPSIVLGHSRRAATTQFDMVRAFVMLADLPMLPFRPGDRVDIVPVDFVADSVVALHQKERPMQMIYHLSSGIGSQTYGQITDFLSKDRGKSGPVYIPALEGSFSWLSQRLASAGGKLGQGATLLKVFWPYLIWNTVFDNSRVVSELGKSPSLFTDYCLPLLKFSKEHNFKYPYQDWPNSAQEAAR